MMMKKIRLIAIILLLLLGNAFSQRYGESNDFSYALKLYNEGFYDIAAQQFNLFVNRYPNSERVPDAKYYQAFSLYKLKDFDNARIEFQSLAVSFPDNKRAAEAWVKVGECYLKLGKPEEAARAFETVKVLYPDNPNAPGALYKAALVYFNQGKLQKAKIILQDFLDRYLDSSVYPDGRLLYAHVLVREGDFNQARKEYDKVLKSDAGAELLAQAHLGLAHYFEELGQPQRAEDEFRLILTKFAATGAAFPAVRDLGQFYLRSAQYRSALSLLNKNLNRFKSARQQAALKLLIAAAYYFQHQYDTVTQMLNPLLSQNLPDSLTIPVNFYLGMATLQQNDLKSGIGYFENILDDSNAAKVAPEFLAESQKQRGLILLKTGNFGAGVNALLSFVKSHPSRGDNARIMITLFQTALQNRNSEMAESFYRQFLKDYPHHSQRDELLFSLGKYYFRQKKYPLSEDRFAQFIQKYPCSAKYDSTLAYSQVISDFYSVEQNVGVNRLARLIGQFLAQEDVARLKLDLAHIYLAQLKNVDEAIRIARNITRSESDSTILGEAYYLIGIGYQRKAELDKFRHQSGREDLAAAADAFKNAMQYLDHLSAKDSVTFAFLSTNLRQDDGSTVPVPKQIEYWRHFLQNFNRSPLAANARLVLADLYLSNADTLNSLNQLDSLLQNAPDVLAGRAYYKSAAIYLNSGQAEQAESYLKNFLLKIPVHPLRAKAFKLLADISEKRGDYETCAQFWKKLLEEYDYTDEAETGREYIPAIYLYAGKYDDVIRTINHTFPVAPHADLLLARLSERRTPLMYFYLGKAYFEKNNLIKARKNLLVFLNRGQKPAYRDEARYYLAQIAIEERDNDSAILHLKSILADDKSPFFVQASSQLADIYFEQAKYADAQKLYSKLSSRTTKPEEKLHFDAQVIVCLIKQGKLKSYQIQLKTFKSKYKKEKQLKNYLALFEFELGKYYYSGKKYDPAIRKFKTVARKYKQSDYADDAEYYLGLTYTVLNKVDDAQKILSNFIEKKPQSELLPNVYITLGSLYYRGDKPELAVGAFQKAVELARTRETRQIALSNLIRVYQDLGLWDGLLTQAREYVKEFPHAPDVMSKKILIGTTLTRLNRFSEAIDYLKKLKYLANSDQEPEIQFYIGEAYFNAGQYQNAIREFVKIPLLSKQTKLQWEASALYYSGQAYEKMGKINDAIRMYQEIVNRPGILPDLKREAKKRIVRLKQSD